MMQPKLSLAFAHKTRPAWNGIVVYKTLGRLSRAARNLPDMVPPDVLRDLQVHVRTDGGNPMPLDNWAAVKR